MVSTEKDDNRKVRNGRLHDDAKWFDFGLNFCGRKAKMKEESL